MTIIQITFFLTALRLLLGMFLRTDYSRLYCGMAAFAGFKDLSQAEAILASAKMKVLGLFNESRGEQGCGIYVNGNIIKGHNDVEKKSDTRLFHNLISSIDEFIPNINPEEGLVSILHCRKASYGSQIKDNNHPFLVKAEKEKDDIVLA